MRYARSTGQVCFALIQPEKQGEAAYRQFVRKLISDAPWISAQIDIFEVAHGVIEEKVLEATFQQEAAKHRVRIPCITDMPRGR